jgi:hypothetical protein
MIERAAHRFKVACLPQEPRPGRVAEVMETKLFDARALGQALSFGLAALVSYRVALASDNSTTRPLGFECEDRFGVMAFQRR